AFDNGMLAGLGGSGIDVEIELLDGADVDQTIAGIISRATAVVRAPRRFLKFVVLTVNLPADQLLNVAESSRVLFINPAAPFRTHDERSAQIVAGNLTGEGVKHAARFCH